MFVREIKYFSLFSVIYLLLLSSEMSFAEAPKQVLSDADCSIGQILELNGDEFKDRINACEEHSNSGITTTSEELQAYFKANKEASKAKVENLITLSLLGFIATGWLWFGSLIELIQGLSLLIGYDPFASRTPADSSHLGIKLITFLLFYTVLWFAAVMYFEHPL